MNDSGRKDLLTEGMDTFFNLSLDLLCIADTDGNFIKVNQAWENVLGYPAGELQTRKFLEFVHPDDMQTTLDAMATLGDQKLILNFTNRYRCRDGSYRHIEWNSQPQGKLIYAVARDVTERLKTTAMLVENGKRNNELAAQTRSFNWDIDIDGLLTYLSDTFTLVMEYLPAELVGKKQFMDVLAEGAEAAAFANSVFDKISRSEAFVGMEGLFCTKSGKIVRLLINGMPLYDLEGNLCGYRGAATDISERALDEKKYFALFDNATDAIFVADPASRQLVDCNKAAEVLTGYSKAELLALSAAELHPPDRREETMAGFQKQAEGSNVLVVSEVLTKDNKRIPVEINSSAIITENNNYVFGVFKNITERKAAEQRQTQYLSLLDSTLDSTADGILVLDLEGHVNRYNQNFSDMWGIPAGALDSGEPYSGMEPTITQLTDPDKFFARVMRYSQSPEVADSDTIEFKDGRFFEFNSRPQRIGSKIVGRVWSFRDITERKRAELELVRIADNLARSNRELEQFAYIASHDLQEPLRMVSSYTQLLAKRYEDQLDDKARMFINYAVDGAQRMQGLINDLLTYSRVMTKGKEFTATDSCAALNDSLRSLSATIAESQSLITHDYLPVVKADAVQLAQLFQNLIGNAVKFRADDVPRINVSATDSGREWQFAVSDNGIGIDPKYADKVFEIFQRLHTRAEYPGTGIGLAVCKNIVTRHGGKIWFESEPGKGTTFYFTLPK